MRVNSKVENEGLYSSSLADKDGLETMESY